MPEMNIGDWMILAGMGSYTYGPKSNFNGMTATDRLYTYNEEVQQKQVDSQAGLIREI